MTIPAYPLQWPANWKRIPPAARTADKFGKRARGVSIAEAVLRIRDELRRMGIQDADLVVSTDVPLRLDGWPRSDQREPGDPGAAVYWRDGGATRCMAIDRYTTVAGNLAAIAATLEAMRAIERHGGAEILNRAFAGFAALAPPVITAPWRELLGFAAGDTLTYSMVERQFRKKISGQHPDQGGYPEVFKELVAARDSARDELCFDTDQSNWGK